MTVVGAAFIANAGVAPFRAGLAAAALAAALAGGFAAAFVAVFIVDGLAAMPVATPVAVLGITESQRGRSHKLLAGQSIIRLKRPRKPERRES